MGDDIRRIGGSLSLQGTVQLRLGALSGLNAFSGLIGKRSIQKLYNPSDLSVVARLPGRVKLRQKRANKTHLQA